MINHSPRAGAPHENLYDAVSEPVNQLFKAARRIGSSCLTDDVFGSVLSHQDPMAYRAIVQRQGDYIFTRGRRISLPPGAIPIPRQIHQLTVLASQHEKPELVIWDDIGSLEIPRGIDPYAEATHLIAYFEGLIIGEAGEDVFDKIA